MDKKLDFTDLEIQKLFQNFYIIPDYQREFVWGEKQVIQLLNDLYDEFSTNPASDYFLGSLVVCKASDATKYEVIDGQQRLITLSLLLNNIKRIYAKANEPTNTIQKLLYSETITITGEIINSNIVDIQYDGKEVLDDLYKLGDGDELSNSLTDGLPGKTIYEAHTNISDFLKSTFDIDSNFQDLKKFLGYFLNKVKVIQIETPEIGKALKIFETINERGVSLDQVDLLKNLLFIQMDRHEFSRLKKDWDKFKKAIIGGKIKEKPLRFLRYFIISNYEMSRDSKGLKIVREDDIYQWFIDNESKCSYKSDAINFVRNLQENANFYIEMMKNRHGDNENINMTNVSRLVGSGFKQHYLLILSAKNMKPELFNHLLKQLETLLFYYNVVKEPARDVEKRFVDWTEEIRKIKTKNSLNEFIESRIQTDIEGRSNAFEVNFLGLRGNEMQKYKLKYILSKLSNYVEKSKIGDAEDGTLELYFKKNIEIEHILPEKPTIAILQTFCGGDEKEYSSYKYKLGNLTLLEKPINGSIQRKPFPEKLEGYKTSNIYLTKSIAEFDKLGSNTSINRINDSLKKFTIWDKQAIIDRQKMLFELAKKIWKIEQL